ncbi:MAG: hypothetical protein WAV76_14115 [Bacteroidota bacterium]
MFIQKKAQILIFIFAAATTISFGQRKSDLDQNQSVSSSFLTPNTSGLMFGWFDPARLLMRQSISFSYATSGDRGYSLAAYTNSLLYQLSDPLSFRCDISLLDSPFNSMGDAFSKNISGLYLTRAEINYRPSDNVLLQLQYRKVPDFLWNGYNDFDLDDLRVGSNE